MNKVIMDFSVLGTKTAYVENRILKELFVDSSSCSSAAGNIYVGVVRNIVSKQFVFIDIGLKKNAFLQLNDHKEQAFLKNKNIQIGQHVIVQVIKDETEDKGACVTTGISLSGRGMVLMPHSSDNIKNIFISSKIKDSQKRQELTSFIQSILSEEYDVVVRTNIKDMYWEEIKNELKELDKKFKEIIQKGQHVKGPYLLHTEDLYYGKSLKSVLSDHIDEIIVNAREEIEHVRSILLSYGLGDKLKLYEEDIHIFDYYDLEKQIKTALNTKVWLKSGGFLIIEKTAACHVIDVNTGKFVAVKNKEKTVLKNNLEAAEEIAKQIRLRNLSGMIIVDFVDMDSEDNTKWLIAHFKKELKKDRLNVHVVSVSSLNLVQLTRKKTRPELAVHFMRPCHVCDGTGYFLDIAYICERIYNMLNRILKQTAFNKITVSSNSKIINFLKGMEGLDRLCRQYDAQIILHTITTGKIDYYEITKEMKGV